MGHVIGEMIREPKVGKRQRGRQNWLVNRRVAVYSVTGWDKKARYLDVWPPGQGEGWELAWSHLSCPRSSWTRYAYMENPGRMAE